MLALLLVLLVEKLIAEKLIRWELLVKRCLEPVII